MFRSLRKALPALVLLLLLVGPVKAACPEGDLFADCRINSLDLKVMADLWLDGPGSQADLIGGNGVDMADFAKLAENWGVIGQPTGSLYVRISPQAAIDLGAKWRITGGAWQSSDQTLPDLAIGPYTIEFKPIDTWAEPHDQNVEVVEYLITDARASSKHPLVINEFMAHTDYLVPPHESNDWIELYNITGSTVNLDSDWYLSDNADDLKKWALPSVELA